MKKSIMTVGLSGAHRTGKTTLAEHVADTFGLKFVKTNTADLFRRMQISPTDYLTTMQRLEIQNLILDEACILWKEVGFGFVTDRTPLDMAAYMLMSLKPEASEEENKAIHEYVNRCFEVTNSIFSNITIIQPGIPLVKEPFKGHMSNLHIQKLNCLIRGLSNDDRCTVACFSLPPSMTDLNKRVKALGRVIQKSHVQTISAVEKNSIH